MRELPARPAPGVDRFGKEHARDHAALPRDEADRLHEGQVAVGHRTAERSVGVLVADRHGMHARFVRDRRLEERRVELEQRIAHRGRALGKEAHAIAFRERPMDQRVDAGRVVAPRSPYEERPRALRDPAGHRPVANLALRDEARRPYARDQEHIQPRNVVRGHDGADFRRCATFDPRLQAEDADELSRPPAMEAALPRPRDAREDEAQDEECRRDMGEEPHPAHAAQDAAGPWMSHRTGLEAEARVFSA